MGTMPRPERAAKGRPTAAAVLLTVLVLSGAPITPSAAQQPSAIAHLDQLAKVGKNLLQRLRPEVRQALSAGGQQLVFLTENVEKIKAAKKQTPKGKGNPSGPKALPQGFGSDPLAAEDFVSRLAGMTQSETSVGWCASNAVIGFNDSGSFVATLFLLAGSPSGSFSFNGWSQSTNAGASYTDRGILLSDPLPPGSIFRDLFGDPVIACTSSATFYYASLAIDFGSGFSFVNSGISVSRSTNGGTSWGPAVLAASKDISFHFLDKEWMAVHPGATASPDDDILHVTYTDFDISGFFDPSAPCPGDFRTAIEYVRSTDGGATWSAPQVIEEVCGGETGAFLQGSQVEVGLDTEIYVAWEHYAAFPVRDIRIRRSPNVGLSFGSIRVVTPVTGIGDGFVLQGVFRAFLDLQGLAVDRSSGSSRGSVYISWHDGRNLSQPDPFAFCEGASKYCFGDVLVTRSTNRGATWSAPVRVNDDALSLSVDQFMPALDVDRQGNVWVSYYDRRRDARNVLIDAFVAKSTNGGDTWVNKRLTQTSFAPVTGWQDIVVNPFYMGDYIAVAADATQRFPGVVLAWGDNSLGDANVLQSRF